MYIYKYGWVPVRCPPIWDPKMTPFLGAYFVIGVSTFFSGGEGVFPKNETEIMPQGRTVHHCREHKIMCEAPDEVGKATSPVSPPGRHVSPVSPWMTARYTPRVTHFT